ncbi:rhomboid family intramembrane serine protease [Pseudovibrio brasiliensis]|uniref:Rhomboid family intramembrane serine protease n=1 Tax=Pseudovibrio brasiliensis TaxID=1898042 RepID=A0ABX8AJ49_9HYPH|nr:rhomboid family intramembrane serine protease [Pseudovibrio brasiliensis]QUS54642.1 rhomboid family intramembrane serine protease [Pseudovibrio brasiliensis]
MNQSNEEHQGPDGPYFHRPAREPMFNLPTVVVGLSLVLIGIHLVRAYVLSPNEEVQTLLLFAFWPVRYVSGFMAQYSWPGETASAVWSFLTYGFLHGSAEHIGFNVLWIAVFGSAVARRFGATRFLLLSAVCAVAGAGAHLATNWGDQVPVIGASAAVSGQMAASLRFIFEAGGPMSSFRRHDTHAYSVPARPLMEALSDRRVLTFILVWFGLNFLFGIWSAPIAGEGVSIAWQAHVGGFIAGLILFPLLDPIKRRWS